MPRKIDAGTLEQISGQSFLNNAIATSQNVMKQREASQLRDMRAQQIQQTQSEMLEHQKNAYVREGQRQVLGAQVKNQVKNIEKNNRLADEQIDLNMINTQNQATQGYYENLVNSPDNASYQATLASMEGKMPEGQLAELRRYNIDNPQQKQLLQQKAIDNLAQLRAKDLQRVKNVGKGSSATPLDLGTGSVPALTTLYDTEDFAAEVTPALASATSQMAKGMTKAGHPTTGAALAQEVIRLQRESPEDYAQVKEDDFLWFDTEEVDASKIVNQAARNLMQQNVVQNATSGGGTSAMSVEAQQAGIAPARWKALRENPKLSHLSDSELVARVGKRAQ